MLTLHRKVRPSAHPLRAHPLTSDSLFPNAGRIYSGRYLAATLYRSLKVHCPLSLLPSPSSPSPPPLSVPPPPTGGCSATPFSSRSPLSPSCPSTRSTRSSRGSTWCHPSRRAFGPSWTVQRTLAASHYPSPSLSSPPLSTTPLISTRNTLYLLVLPPCCLGSPLLPRVSCFVCSGFRLALHVLPSSPHCRSVTCVL